MRGKVQAQVSSVSRCKPRPCDSVRSDAVMGRKSAFADWKVVRTVKKHSKRAESDGDHKKKRLYALIRCPRCHGTVECVASRVDQLKSVVARAHLKHCRAGVGK